MDKLLFILTLLLGFLLGYATCNYTVQANTPPSNICTTKFVGEMTMKEVLYCIKNRPWM